jgi:hypothetical protein
LKKQLKEGQWSILSKEKEKQKDELGKKSIKWNSWMPWAIGIENPVEACYIHGGSLTEESDGCIHVPRSVAKILYGLVKKGTKVKIIHFVPMSLK